MKQTKKLTATLLVALVFALLGMKPVSAQAVLGGELIRNFSDQPAPKIPELLSGVDYEFNASKRSFVDSMVSTDSVTFAGVAGQSLESSDTIIDPDATRGRDGQLAGKFDAKVFNPVTNRWEALQRGAANQFLSRVETSRLAVGAYSWVTVYNYSSGRAHSGFYIPLLFGLKITLVAKDGRQEVSVGRRILVVDPCGWPMGCARDVDQARLAYMAWRAETPGLRVEAPYYMPSLKWGRDHGFLTKFEAPVSVQSTEQVPSSPSEEGMTGMAPAAKSAPAISASDPQLMELLTQLVGGQNRQAEINRRQDELNRRQEEINRRQMDYNAQTSAAVGAIKTNQDALGAGLQDTQVGLLELQRAVSVKPDKVTGRTYTQAEVLDVNTLEPMSYTFPSGKKATMQVKLLVAKKPLCVTVKFKFDNEPKVYQLKEGESLKVIWQNGLVIGVEVIDGA